MKDVDRCYDTFNVIEKYGMQPNLTSFNWLIRGLKYDDVSNAVSVFQLMERDKIEPNSVSFYNFLMICVRAKDSTTFSDFIEISKTTEHYPKTMILMEQQTLLERDRYDCLQMLESYKAKTKEPEEYLDLSIYRFKHSLKRYNPFSVQKSEKDIINDRKRPGYALSFRQQLDLVRSNREQSKQASSSNQNFINDIPMTDDSLQQSDLPSNNPNNTATSPPDEEDKFRYKPTDETLPEVQDVFSNLDGLDLETEETEETEDYVPIAKKPVSFSK